MMTSPIPDEWRHEAPESLVAGSGPYAVSLAFILGTVAIRFDRLHAAPEVNSGGGYPRVLDNLKQALVVVPEDMSPAEALRCHQSVWDWVSKLSSAGDQHELAFLIVLSENAAKEFDQALAVGLSVPVVDPAVTGHAIWRRSDALKDCLSLIAATRRMDLVRLMAQRSRDGKRLALKRLCAACMQNDLKALEGAARSVQDAFHGATYHLDLFCRPPSHRHGSLLRGWLNAAVTGPVTQDWCDTGTAQLAAWLGMDDEQESL